MLGRTLRSWLIRGAVAAVLCGAFLGGRALLYYVCGRYTYANTIDVDFDYAGGRVRVRKYFLWVKLRDRIEETHHTALYRELIGEPPPPVWRAAYNTPYVDRLGGRQGHGLYARAVSLARDEGWWTFVQDGLRPDAIKPFMLQCSALWAAVDHGGADPGRWATTLDLVILLREELGMPLLGAEDLTFSRLDEELDSLIALEQDREASGGNGATASERDTASTVRLPDGRKVDPRTDEGWEAFQLAVQNGEVGLVHELMAKGVDYDRPGDSGRSAVDSAVFHRRPMVLAVLLVRGADPNTVDETGRSPLHTAASYDDVTILRFLLDSGADLGGRDARGRTALHIAANAGRAEAAELLVARGADESARDNEGRTPLDLARTSKAAGARKVAKLLARSAPPG